MELLVIGVIAGVLIHKLWVKLVVWHTLREMKQAGIDINALLEQAEDDGKPAAVCVRLEFERDQYFLYNADTQTFMAQGRDYQEIWEKIKPMVQGQTVVVTEGEDSVIERFHKTKSVAEVG
jgi:hypothetical protein